MDSLSLSQGRLQARFAPQSIKSITKTWEHDRFAEEKQKKLASDVHEWRAFAQSSSAIPLPPLRRTYDRLDTLKIVDGGLNHDWRNDSTAKETSKERFPISKNMCAGREVFPTLESTASAPAELSSPTQIVAVPGKRFNPEQVRERESNEFFSHLGVEKNVKEPQPKKRASLDRPRPTVSVLRDISYTLPATSPEAVEESEQCGSNTTNTVTLVLPEATSNRPVSRTDSVPNPLEQRCTAETILPPYQRAVASVGTSVPVYAVSSSQDKLCATTPYLLPHQRAASSPPALNITSNIKHAAPSLSSQSCTAAPYLLPHQRAALSSRTLAAEPSAPTISSKITVTPSSRQVTRDDAVRRMIFANLGIRAPKRTEEQTKMRQEEREARRALREEREREVGMSQWRASRVKA
ncbi:unnamed protein product [Diplocarpon coronariae]|nr:hypothetical protein JHW43_002057 [Diplocarpon mali]